MHLCSSVILACSFLFLWHLFLVLELGCPLFLIIAFFSCIHPSYCDLQLHIFLNDCIFHFMYHRLNQSSRQFKNTIIYGSCGMILLFYFYPSLFLSILPFPWAKPLTLVLLKDAAPIFNLHIITHTHTHTQSTLDVFWFLLSSFHVKYLSSIYGQCDHQTYYFWITLCNIITPLQMKKSKQGWIFSCSRQNFVDFWMEPRLISLHCQCFALPLLSSHHFCHCILIIDAKIIAEFDIAEVRWLD